MATTTSTNNGTPTTVRDGNVDLDSHSNFDVAKQSLFYGMVLAGAMAVYLIILNTIYGEIPLGLRFAKHLLIIPVVWIAFGAYAKTLPEGKVFKAEIGYVLRIGLYAAMGIALLNLLYFAFAENSFEQFMQEGKTLAGVMINSTFLIFETFVFVMMFGFILMQAYKGGGSPEDPGVETK